MKRRRVEVGLVVGMAAFGAGLGVVMHLGPAGVVGVALVCAALAMVVVLLDWWDRGR